MIVIHLESFINNFEEEKIKWRVKRRNEEEEEVKQIGWGIVGVGLGGLKQGEGC